MEEHILKIANDYTDGYRVGITIDNVPEVSLLQKVMLQ
jgi:hypothetical protein